MDQANKNLFVHVTSSDAYLLDLFRAILNQDEFFSRYYSGFVYTFSYETGVSSTCYCYYDIPYDTVWVMHSHLGYVIMNLRPTSVIVNVLPSC